MTSDLVYLILNKLRRSWRLVILLLSAFVFFCNIYVINRINQRHQEELQSCLQKLERQETIRKKLPFSSIEENIKGRKPFRFTVRPWNVEETITLTKTCIKNPVIRWSMVFVIKSAAGNFKRRRAIRSTWGRVKLLGQAMFEYVFVVGKSNHTEVSMNIEEENFMYGDMLQFSVFDSAEVIPEKVLAGMQWATGLPDNWLYATIDDDFIVNHSRLTSYFNQLVANYTNEDGKTSFNQIPIVCVYSYQHMDRPSRDPNSKWYMSLEDYPPNLLPVYCRGGMYTANKVVVRNLLEVSSEVPRLLMDDVWITGLMRLKVNNDSRSIVPAPGSRLSEHYLHSSEWLDKTISHHLWGNTEENKVDIPNSMIVKWKSLYNTLAEDITC